MRMTMNEFQTFAMSTARYDDKKIPAEVYCSLKLAGESGEFCEKMGKIYRDKDGIMSLESKLEMAKELGDVIWYVANLAALLGYKLDEIAEINKDKLLDRVERGVIHGAGDNR